MEAEPTFIKLDRNALYHVVVQKPIDQALVKNLEHLSEKFDCKMIITRDDVKFELFKKSFERLSLEEKADLLKILSPEPINRDLELELDDVDTKGLTIKDIKAYYEDYYGEGDYQFSFYILKDDKEYCIYNEYDNQDWWPMYHDDEFGDDNAASAFVPNFLHEASENSYESRYPLEETLEKLIKIGYSPIKLE